MFGAEGEVGVSGRLRKGQGFMTKECMKAVRWKIANEEGPGRRRKVQW